MKDRKKESRLVKFIRTNQYKYLRNLTMFLILALVGCGSFIGGILYRNNALRYSGTHSGATQSSAVSETTTAPAVTTTPPVAVTEATTTTKPSVMLNSDGIAAKIISSECAATAKYEYTNSYSFSEDKKYKDISIPFTKKSYTMTYDGIVSASLPIDNISVSVDNQAKTIAIILPQPQITEHVVDKESVSFADKSKNILNRLTEEDYNKVYIEENPKMEEKARANGLLDEVRKKTEEAITELLMRNPDINGVYTINYALA